jgi:cation diffusion facilitator CzcD-associated flavoprotein CzcO
VNDADVAIVGAGPYGLSIGAHLRGRGVATRIFGRPLETWKRHMPEGMFLKSEGFASSLSDPAHALTLGAYCRDHGVPYGDVGVPVPLDVFVSYGEWFQRQAFLDVEPTDVVRIEWKDGRFRLDLESGETASAARVVVAAGVGAFRHVPPPLADLPPSHLTHAFDHWRLDRFRDADVGVVGAGQSALETAVLLAEHGARPTVIARCEELRWNPRPAPEPRSMLARLRSPTSPLGAGWKLRLYTSFASSFRRLSDDSRSRIVRTTLGPAGAWWLRDRVPPHMSLLTGTRVNSARETGEQVTLGIIGPRGEDERQFDHVIAGTGYQVDLRRLTFLPDDMRASVDVVGGSPRLSPHFESSVRGLYFVGLAAANTFGPLMRFVCGATLAARRVAAHASS